MKGKEYKIKDLMEKYGVKRLVVNGWIKKKLFPNAELRTDPIQHWIVPESDLKNFVLPEVKPGRPRDENPSEEAKAKRLQREKNN